MNDRINILKRSIYFDIAKVILFVIISIPIWLNLNATTMEIFNNIDNKYINYEVLNNKNHIVKYMKDDEALYRLETDDIIVYNDHYSLENYSLLLRINKNINLNNIKINVNFEINELNNYNSYEDDKYKYFIIDESALKASSFKYNISLWSNEEKTDEINYDYILDKSVNI